MAYIVMASMVYPVPRRRRVKVCRGSDDGATALPTSAMVPSPARHDAILTLDAKSALAGGIVAGYKYCREQAINSVVNRQ